MLRNHSLVLALFAALGLGVPATARAGGDFEDGFEDQLGRILAFEAVQAGKALLFYGAAPVAVAPPPVVVVPPPPPPVYYAPPVAYAVPVPVAVPVAPYPYPYPYAGVVVKKHTKVVHHHHHSKHRHHGHHGRHDRHDGRYRYAHR